MTECEAHAWLAAHFDVSRETLDKLEAYAALVAQGQQSQNLVSASTLPTFWSRHIVDSAQLVLLAKQGSWLDIGSGAGLPGIVTAILTGAHTMLVESRVRRAAFLNDLVGKLALPNICVVTSKLQNIAVNRVDNITARAVAALDHLIEIAAPFAHQETVWLLPKGKSAQTELASLPRAWQGVWEVRASVTDRDSRILVGRGIRVHSKR